MRGLVDPQGGTGGFAVGIIYILWFTFVRMGLTVACVHSSRLGTVFVLLGKLEWEQRRFQDALFQTLASLADLREQPHSTIDDYCNAHWSIMSTIKQEKRQLERILNFLVVLSLQYFIAFLLTTHVSGCAPGYWVAMSIGNVGYFIGISFVLARFNDVASTTAKIIRRAEREISFVSLELVRLKNKVVLDPIRAATGHLTVPRTGMGTMGKVLGDRRSLDVNLSHDREAYGNTLPHVSVLGETSETWMATIPYWLQADTYSGRTFPLVLPTASVPLHTTVIEARLAEAEAHSAILAQLTRGDEFLVTFAGRPLTFETARGIAGLACLGVYLAYQLYKGGGYSFELAFACGA
ncbi:hypothetical protein M427DRAFT_157199 [Gonapodya prolifera JEL478]|uniref:Uncharacterized protein n=1 Tax=Gonapodya prolifera (strain JEL478) TaxID=1344416 RepID=A0A139A745_GONPJ|nr:hypothetical protein M427DRAFT_157199 [Gonapodya prolifera JEL478]|eukprot:KXS12620.1 hypothetical protein M427DRAFT_157199 [Gonapodya prolifera JEL478]